MNRVQSRAAFRRLAGEGDGCIGLYLQGEEISFGSDHHLLRLYIPAPEQVLGKFGIPPPSYTLTTLISIINSFIVKKKKSLASFSSMAPSMTPNSSGLGLGTWMS